MIEALGISWASIARAYMWWSIHVNIYFYGGLAAGQLLPVILRLCFRRFRAMPRWEWPYSRWETVWLAVGVFCPGFFLLGIYLALRRFDREWKEMDKKDQARNKELLDRYLDGNP